jgi:hypothetical protein
VDTLSLDMRLLRCARLLSAVWWWLVIRWHILSNDIGVSIGILVNAVSVVWIWLRVC